jgi:tRNA(adenine34) deaminase
MRGAPIGADIRRQLDGYAVELKEHRVVAADDELSRVAVASAVVAGLEGNAAVGALLVDPEGGVLLSERNQMFVPYFRSDGHAEMVLLSRYEEDHRGTSDLRGHTLVTSLEPCEMCMVRIINSGVSMVRYVASDLGKGGINGPNTLAPHWAALAAYQDFGQADCDPRLAEIALDAFSATIGGITQRLLELRLIGDGHG